MVVTVGKGNGDGMQVLMEERDNVEGR